jgi:hypothetical protein
MVTLMLHYVEQGSQNDALRGTWLVLVTLVLHYVEHGSQSDSPRGTW